MQHLTPVPLRLLLPRKLAERQPLLAASSISGILVEVQSIAVEKRDVSGPKRKRVRKLSFDLRRRVAAHSAILYALDLIEHDGEGLRDRPFLDRKAALARLLRDIEAGILLSEHVAGDGPTVFAHTCRVG